MNTIKLSFTGLEWKFVNVELPEEPLIGEYGFGTTLSLKIDYQTDHINWKGEIKRLVDSCPVVSDTEKARGMISEGLATNEFIVPYKIYSIHGWKAEVTLKDPCMESHTCKHQGIINMLCSCDQKYSVATLSKVESEEKEKPKLYSISELETRAIDFLVWYTGMPKDKVRVSYDHFLREQGF